MNQSTLEKAFGLPEPWEITDDTISAEEQRLDITIAFKKGKHLSLSPVWHGEQSTRH